MGKLSKKANVKRKQAKRLEFAGKGNEARPNLKTKT